MGSLLQKFAKRKRNGDKAGLFESYKDYTFELSSLLKNFSEIDEKKPNEEVTDITEKIETSYKKLKALHSLIKNADFGTLKNVKILNGQNLFKSLQKVYRYDEPKKTSKDEKYLPQDQVEDFSFYTDVVFPLQNKDLEEIRLYDKPFLAKIETKFEQTTVWSVDKAALNKQREIQIEKRVDDKLGKLQLHENIDSQFVNSYQDQLGKDLFILNFKAAKGKDFYVNVKNKSLKIYLVIHQRTKKEI